MYNIQVVLIHTIAPTHRRYVIEGLYILLVAVAFGTNSGGRHLYIRSVCVGLLVG